MVIRTRVIRYLRKDVDIKVTPKNTNEYMTEGKVSLALSVNLDRYINQGQLQGKQITFTNCNWKSRFNQAKFLLPDFKNVVEDHVPKCRSINFIDRHTGNIHQANGLNGTKGPPGNIDFTFFNGI